MFLIEKITKNHMYVAMFLLIAMFIAMAGVKVSAAPVGCYVKSQGSTAGTVSIVAATCPNANSSDAARYAGKCWISTASSQGQTAYREVACDSITVGTTTVQPSLPTNGGGGTGGGTTIEDEPIELPSTPGKDQCGKGDRKVEVGFNIGCRGEEYPRGQLNPIVDMAFALFRLLAAGVGLVVTGSIIVAGIQYSASRGNPQATQASIARVSNSIVALLIYVFMFTIANFLVPGGMFI
jgi:hypothetical protein